MAADVEKKKRKYRVPLIKKIPSPPPFKPYNPFRIRIIKLNFFWHALRIFSHSHNTEKVQSLVRS